MRIGARNILCYYIRLSSCGARIPKDKNVGEGERRWRGGERVEKSVDAICFIYFSPPLQLLPLSPKSLVLGSGHARAVLLLSSFFESLEDLVGM